MISFGTFDAKNKLSELLDLVAKGEKVAITRHGRTVAFLVPAGKEKKRKPEELFEAIVEFAKGNRLDGVSIRELIEEGRRF